MSSNTFVTAPVIPVSTTWIGAAQGLGNLASNWSPTFAAIGLTNDYGNATIKAGSTVVFNGTATADMTSLALGTAGVVQVNGSAMVLEDTTKDTVNSGTITLDQGASLLLQGGLDNIGTVTSVNGTVVVSGQVHLYGGGSLLNTGSNQAWLTGANASALLINSNNTIGGAGTISVALQNQGSVVANGPQRLVLSAADANSGHMTASGNSTPAGSPRTGGLEIQQNLDNTGGTLLAQKNALIQLDNGVTLYGGTLTTLHDGSLITSIGSVVLNGGTAGMALAGAVTSGAGSTLTLTGTMSSVTGQGIVSSGNGTVLLSALTLHNGELDADALATGAAGTIAVNGSATLDGLALAGTMQVTAGNTLVLDGSINPVIDNGRIELSGGTLIIGTASTNAATFGTALAGSAAGTFGTLLLDDGGANLVTGVNSGSSLTNSWLIAGSGALGNGQLAITNTTSGTIGAIGSQALVLNTSAAVQNAGLIGAFAGTLDLLSNVANTGGTIGALTGLVLLDGATIAGGTITSTAAGSVRVAGHGKLDGAASAVTLATGAQVAVDAGDTLSVAGTVTNHGTMTVLGNATVGFLATLGATGLVTLNGGGVIALADLSGNGSSTSQAIIGSPTGTLDNIDNQIRGYGLVGVGDNTLTLINEAKGTINATAGGGPLTLNTGTIALVNHGLLQASTGGTLDLRGSIVSTGATLLAAGGIALLDTARFSGGTIASSGGGSVRSINGTLDGSTNVVLVNTGAEVAVDAGDTLTAIGTISNSGTMHATGGLLRVASGSLTNVGQLRADLNGVLDLRATVGNAGGTVAAGSGTVHLDGITLTNGLLTSTPNLGGLIDILGSSTLVGGCAVAAGVTAAPVSGLLNTANLQVQSGDTLTLRGTITNRSVIGVIGDGTVNPPATLRASGTVALTGGGTIALTDSTGSGTAATQIVTGTASGDTLDNLDNTVSGSGELGTGDRLFTLINEAGGTIDATTGTMIVNTGTNAVVNKGLMVATGGVLDLNGTIINSGTLAAGGGSIQIDGATISGGTLATSLGGAIYADGAGTLANVTLAPNAAVIVDGSEALTLQGAIVNRSSVSLAGNSFFNIPATLLVSGTVSLSGGGVIASAFSDIDGAPAPSTADTLDNINNTINGAGEIGGGSLTLINEAAGIIRAAGGTLIVDTGARAIVNKGLLDSTTGVLDLHGALTNTGGTIAANGGTTELDGASISGGTFANSAGGRILVAGSAVLNGVTLALGSQVTAVAGNVLTLLGSIVNHGTLNANGDPFFNTHGTVLTGGTLALTGSGTVAFADAIISTNGTASLIDNTNNILLGYGTIGAGDSLLKLRNESAGLVEAMGGTLVVNTGTNTIVNLGTFAAAGGTLVVQGVLDNTGGGTLTALDLGLGAGAAPGIIRLDGGTMRGGTLRTDLADPRSLLQITAKGGTLDGTAGAVTLATGAVAAASAGGALTIAGAIVNHGSLAVLGNSFNSVAANLLVSGSVTLSGGGSLMLADTSGNANTPAQVITAAPSGGTLDNVDNLISGYGQLGLATLGLLNEAKGVIKATGGTLVVNTGPNVISNKGLMESAGGVLTLRGTVDGTSSGTIAALDSGNLAGVTLLDGATLKGGTLVTDMNDPASLVGLTINGGTLDGRTGAMTIAAGGHVAVAALQTLVVEGTLTNHGTVGILGNAFFNQIAQARLSGTVTLNGGGVVSLADGSGVSTGSNTQIISGTASTDTLLNIDNTIVGYGSLGAGTMALVNAAAGTIDAIVGTLWVNTGTSSVTNQGLMEAVAGKLVLSSPVANSGTILAGGSGAVVVDGSIGNTGLVAVAAAGTVTVHGTVAGTSSVTQVANGGTLFLDGGALNSGKLGNSATGLIDITTNGAHLTSLAVSNAGSVLIVGNGYFGQNASLSVSGTVTLSGGGVLSLLDGSGVSVSSTSQTVTGAAPGDTLDNVDNLISGYGQFGAGQLTLINEAKGTIAATVAALVLNTGSVATVNRGLLEAVGGTLVVQGVVDDSAGGTVAAINSGSVAGTVVLDGGTLRGGSIVSNAASPGSALVLTNHGGTLDGAAGAVSLGAHTQANIAAGQTLTLKGIVSDYGVLSVQGNGFFGSVAALDIGGSLTLFNGSTLVMADAAGLTGSRTTQVVTGTAPGATLTNTALITGFGMLGNGALALVNTATGTITATGGVLVIDPGASAATNLGQIIAATGTLQLESTIVNNRTIAAGARGAIIVDGTVNNNGLITVGAAGAVTVHGTVVGNTSLMQIGNGGSAVLDGGSLSGGTLTNAATGVVDITVAGADLTSIAIVNAGTIADQGNGYYGQTATVTVAGTVTLSGGGTVVLMDNSGVGTNSTATQLITGAAANATLDNVDNTIAGYGALGGGQLTLINEAKGTIEASGNTLTVNTGSLAVVNAGLMEAVGATLVLQVAVDNTAGGTIAALASGTTHGVVLLDGATLRGGTITTDPQDRSSGLLISTNGGRLDGTTGAVTLTAASQATVVAGSTLTVAGSIVQHGTVSVQGNGFAGTTGAILIDGKVALSGGGVVALSDASGVTTASATQVITGATTAAELDNIDNSIVGYGAIGNGQLNLVNAASGTIAAVGGTLTVDAGAAGSLTNAGLMEALSGTLDVVTALANSGVVRAFGGAVVLEGSVTGNGLLEFDGASLTLDAGVAAGQTIQFGTFGKSETLDIADPTSIAGTIGGFASGDGIIIENTAVTAVDYQASTGALVLIAGTAAVGTLALAGSYAPGNFIVGTAAAGGSLITLVPGVGTVFNHATASAVLHNPIDFGNHHVGDAISQALTIGNTGLAGPTTEKLDAAIGSTAGAATASGAVRLLQAGSIDTTSLTIGLASNQDGVRKGSAVVRPSTDGTGVDGFGTAPLAAQTIAVAGTLYNFATAGAAPLLAFGAHHVGDALTQALTITNTGTADGFTEKLSAKLGTATGAVTASGSLSGLAASISNASSLTIGLASGQDGLVSGTALLSSTSDGTGIDSLGTTALKSQTITATATLYNYATASLAAPNPIAFGNHHVGDILSTALGVSNTAIADGFSENLDASLGGATGGAIASGAFTGLGASIRNTTNLTIGFSGAKDGALSGTAVLTLKSDGTGIDTLGTTALTSQTIAATGTLYNYATASTVAPIQFGTHHVGDAVLRTLSVTNLGTADGFTEALDGAIGGATGAVTAAGAFTGLGASLTNSTSLTVGLSSAHDGAQTGSAVLTMTSDGAGIDGLGTTALGSRTLVASGMFFNFATAAAVAGVSFGAHHVGDTLSRTLTVANTGIADGLTESLDARLGGATGAVTASGSVIGLAASVNNTNSLVIGLSATHDGVQSGTAALTLASDGAGIDNLGTTALATQTIAASATLFNYATASVAAPNPVAFGNRHVGDVLSQAVAITNLGIADGFTEALDANIGSTTGSIIAAGSLSLLGAAQTGVLTIGLGSARDGVQAGKATLMLTSDGTGIDNLGTTVLAAQTIAATGTLYNYATASALAEVDFGNHHVLDQLSQTVAISNTGAADGFTENLNASTGSGLAGGAFRIRGSVTGLGAGKTDNNSLIVSLSSAQDGDQLGAATVFLASDGTSVDGLGTKALPTQNVLLTASLFSYAAPILSTSTVNFGATRVGIAKTGSLTISNGASQDDFQENLAYSIGAGVPVGYSVTGPVSGVVTSGGTAATASWSEAATKSSVLTTSYATVNLTSTGVGTSGLSDTTLAPIQVGLVSKVYALAVAQISTTSLNFGVVHVGDTVSNGTTISNVGTGALVDVLTGGIGTISGGGFIATGSLGTGVISGASKRLSIGLNTATSGVFNATAALALSSHDADLADVAVAAGPIALTGTVENYATAAIQPFRGSGVFTGSGTHYALNLGTIAVGAIAPAETLDVMNTAGGLADLLSGSFAVSGTGFINTGLAAFGGLGAGVGNTAPTIALSGAKAGVFSETVTLYATGTNSSGYLGILPAETLVVTGTVTPRVRSLTWTGGADTNFANPTNWSDATAGQNPSVAAPGAGDTVTFNGTGGGITGIGTVSALTFGGDSSWHLASAATIVASNSLTVGSTQPGGLLINQAAGLAAQSNAAIAATAGSDGSSASVTGIGSSLHVAGSLTVGGAAAGALSVNAGATVSAGSLDAGLSANSSGVITLTGSHSALTTTGTLSIGDSGIGEMSVLNGATVITGGDLNVGQNPGGAGNIDIEGTSTLIVGGDLNFGAGGPAEITVGPNATFGLDNGVLNGSPGNSTLTLFTTIDPIASNNVTQNIKSSGTQAYTQHVSSSSFNLAPGINYTLDTPALLGSATFTLGDSNTTLVLNADTVSAGTTIAFTDATGTLVVGMDVLGTISVPNGSKFTSVVNPNLGEMLIGGFAGVINGFATGDQIVVQTDGAATFAQSGSVVSVIENGATLGALRFDTAGAAAAAASGGLVDQVLCFLPDTLIATPAGEVKVQALKVGDLVRTAAGLDRAVVWVGEGRVLAPRGRRTAATPVIVRRGALGPGVPHYDLHVTKGHALFIDDVLIPVEFLVNHRSILWDDQAREVSLYHVELETHDVLLANGAPAESYRDDGNRWLFRNANAGWDQPEKPPCAPVLTGGPVVDAVWQRLLERSGPRPGLPLTDDPDVHLLVDGVRVDGARTADRCVFRLPPAVTEVRLVSRAAAPAELGLARDPRVLGVAVRRIEVWQGPKVCVVDAEDERLTDGFHVYEPDGGIRWTDGDAALPLGRLTGQAEVVVVLGGATRYADWGEAA